MRCASDLRTFFCGFVVGGDYKDFKDFKDFKEVKVSRVGI